MRSHVPNLLTGARLVLAVVFFVLLSFYQYEGRGSPWLLNIAFVLYCVALFTDFLDGHLARKWHVEGAFGRIVDPFVDKVLVLGSFAFFAGKNFVIPESNQSVPLVMKTITGVVPTVVVIMLGRELLVTSLRAAAEAAGHKFGADWFGKIKMVVQSVAILVILAYVNYLPSFKGGGWEKWATLFRDFCVWTTVVVTVGSAIGYIRRAISIYGPPAEEKQKDARPAPPIVTPARQ